MRVNHKEFALFEYEQNPSTSDTFKLGDVIINTGEEPNVGVVIQAHGNDEYRTDMHGNIELSKKYGGMRLATDREISRLRPKLISKTLSASF